MAHEPGSAQHFAVACIVLPILGDALRTYLGEACGVSETVLTTSLPALMAVLAAMDNAACVFVDTDAIPERASSCLAIESAVAEIRALCPKCILILLVNCGWEREAALAGGADRAIMKADMGKELQALVDAAQTGELTTRP